MNGSKSHVKDCLQLSKMHLRKYVKSDRQNNDRYKNTISFTGETGEQRGIKNLNPELSGKRDRKEKHFAAIPFSNCLEQWVVWTDF